jgi:SNF family Na+-dependent transporter
MGASCNVLCFVTTKQVVQGIKKSNKMMMRAFVMLPFGILVMIW